MGEERSCFLLPLALLLALLVTVVPGALASEAWKHKALTEMFMSGLETFHSSRVKTPHFQEALHHLTLTNHIESEYLTDLSPKDQLTTCVLCDVIVNAFMEYYKNGKSKDELEALVVDACVTLNIETEEVCSGVIGSNVDTVVYIIDNTPTLTGHQICSVLLQDLDCAETEPPYEWTVDIDLGEKPQYVPPSDPAEGEVLTVLHITDAHYDPMYSPGGMAACDEPTCCRSDQGQPPDAASAAGYWGDYRDCDMPWHSVVSMLTNAVTQNPDINYVYFTGDIIDHGVWQTSIQRNNESFQLFYPTLKQAFGEATVFPAFGNHEAHPFNQYAPDDVTDDTVSSKWLYETMANLWQTWLPADIVPTVMKGGYYTTLVRPGLRIISLNNNVCYKYNWWIHYKPADPSEQLKWLAETLLAAEAAGEKVHILGHVPSGSSDCYSTWSREYNKIVDRFEYTIAAVFNGHTHKDRFQLHYASDDISRASIVAYNGGSLVTYSDVNPNYKVYKVDGNTGAVVDYTSWMFNLTEANLDPNTEPNWYKLYSFREAYGVESMNLTELDKLVHRMAETPEIIQQYYGYSVKEGDPSLASGCDANCQRSQLCTIVTSYFRDTTKCDEITASMPGRAKILNK
ncbi:sphingomyelin phosphodiesterase-like isoform X2 [Schistocerca cancellata]|uniref:sphingomyelin phosphodiesterase-like isoform X2 n=1 Tax=Schistocerca cancellata TaxID=274614 RepID=UPI002119681D|nr:sphingomyelin phosphodiesterase-like isoform X2 [Schistocerca cancellata]